MYKNKIALFVLLTGILVSFGFWSASSGLPEQPIDGPGGALYVVDSVVMEDFAKKTDGYWLFRPAEITTPFKQLIVFNHGYGAYNPMIYGAWLKHLVRRGNIVVFPRYQRNIISPKPKKFIGNAASAVRNAITDLRKRELLTVDDFHLSLVGHSYGGVISAGLANDYKQLEIPKPQVVMMCSPGSGPFKGGVYEGYPEIESDTKMLSIVSVNDPTVGEHFGRHVFKTSPQVKQSNFIRQHPDHYNGLRITARHNECYALDKQFDTGVRNISTKRALRVATKDPVDYYGYWKLFDSLRECSLMDKNCDMAFGNTSKQSYLGNWDANQPVKPLEVFTNPDLLH